MNWSVRYDQPVLFVFLLISFMMLAACTPQQATTQSSEKLEVHYIDVGQGDATLLKGPDFTLLIDAGRHDAIDVTPYLQSQGITDLDLMILTHPHADHVGQADKVIEAFPIKEVWMSGDEHTSATFERVLDALLDSDAEYYEPRAGESFTIGSALVEVYNPESVTGDLHEGSISVRISYGDIKFLFTGDAEYQTERDMINRGHNLKAHIFQLGHHGSTTSNTQDFLDRVQPEVAIYSAREGNSYGHPHDEIIERIENMGIDLYGTDEHGHIIVTTDGKQYTVSTDIGAITTEPKEEQETVRSIDDCLDINTASKVELTEITHIGEERAKELIQFRPFLSLDELSQIHGIGQARVTEIKEQGLACVR
ncbi:MBL fold metallo-hydrolase [Halalkalibacter kiskunsagensis]|uniref:MBL fold metallo-hydrolase n=1 Tax=Halalkalibacter kiskunsagensis TaxID=1548599 RepID=A0ABV6KAW6_9BACI